MVHELKTWPPFFLEVLCDKKTFEVRKDDRNIQVGDKLVLNEFDPSTNSYTGRSCTALVTYKIPGGCLGIESGYCVLSIKRINDDNIGMR